METLSSGEVVIRPCRVEEVEAVLLLWQQADATPSVTDNAAALRRVVTDGPAWLLVAEAGGRIIGSIIGSFDGWRGHIYRLAVHPEHRRRGVARALLAEVEARLAQQGASRIVALVEKDHPLAVGFWTASGYQRNDDVFRFLRNL